MLLREVAAQHVMHYGDLKAGGLVADVISCVTLSMLHGPQRISA